MVFDVATFSKGWEHDVLWVLEQLPGTVEQVGAWVGRVGIVIRAILCPRCAGYAPELARAACTASHQKHKVLSGEIGGQSDGYQLYWLWLSV
jgi:hypothetical protein